MRNCLSGKSNFGEKLMSIIKDYYDVIVIGAGPAGSVSARFAAENGASTLLLERDQGPGNPVRCAEGVSHNGIVPFIEIDPKWISTKIEQARLYSPNGDYLDMFQNGTGYVLDRTLFDPALANLACQKGAQLLTKADAIGLIYDNDKISGVKFRYFDKIYDVKCKIVIGADGVESRVGRWAGIDTVLDLKDLDTCVQYTLTGLDISSLRVDFFFGREVAPGGYIWIFPKSKDTANVGIGIAGDLATDKSPKEYLDEFIEKKFPNASVLRSVCGGVPTAKMLKNPITDNLILVGDAAHQVNPITGGGIVQVMIAGQFAGETAAEAIKANNYSEKFLRKYIKKWNNRLGANQSFMYSVKEKFMRMDNERFNNLVKICSAIPSEKLTLKEFFKTIVKGDPMMILQLAKAFVTSKLK